MRGPLPGFLLCLIFLTGPAACPMSYQAYVGDLAIYDLISGRFAPIPQDCDPIYNIGRAQMGDGWFAVGGYGRLCVFSPQTNTTFRLDADSWDIHGKTLLRVEEGVLYRHDLARGTGVVRDDGTPREWFVDGAMAAHVENGSVHVLDPQGNEWVLREDGPPTAAVEEVVALSSARIIARLENAALWTRSLLDGNGWEPAGVGGDDIQLDGHIAYWTGPHPSQDLWRQALPDGTPRRLLRLPLNSTHPFSVDDDRLLTVEWRDVGETYPCGEWEPPRPRLNPASAPAALLGILAAVALAASIRRKP